MSLYINIPPGTGVPLGFSANTLTDADATITPGTDQKSQYNLPAATLTANRVLTLSNAGATSLLICDVVRFGNEAFTYTIKSAAAATLFTCPVNTPIWVELVFVSGAWVLSIWKYL